MIPKTDDGRVLFALPWHDRGRHHRYARDAAQVQLLLGSQRGWHERVS